MANCRAGPGRARTRVLPGWSPPGRRPDGTLRVWAVETGKLVRSVKVRPGRVKALAVSAEGKSAVFASEADHLLHIWDLEKGRSLHRHAGHAHGLLTVAFSADGKEVVT